MSVEQNNQLVVQETIVNGNEEAVKELEANHQTVYGSIVQAIETHRLEIDSSIDKIAQFFAQKKGYERTLQYEENCNWIEKYFRNNPLKQKQMEMEREWEIYSTSDGVQRVLKGGVWAIEKVAEKLGNHEIKVSLWNLCLNYGNDISGGNILRRKALAAFLTNVYHQLFPQKFPFIKQKPIDFSVHPESAVYIPFNWSEAKRAAYLLYMEYSCAHYMTFHIEEDDKDYKKLMEYWLYLGIFGENQQKLVKQFSVLDYGQAYEFSRVNTLISSFFNNLSISVPSINTDIADEINSNLLKYVPNGDKQKFVRKAGKLIAKTTIATASGVLGVATVNPLLINVAASSAASLLTDLNNSEVIGNCLLDAGVNQESIKKCLDDAAKKKKALEMKQ